MRQTEKQKQRNRNRGTDTGTERGQQTDRQDGGKGKENIERTPACMELPDDGGCMKRYGLLPHSSLCVQDHFNISIRLA
jgi:hypothetical protein